MYRGAASSVNSSTVPYTTTPAQLQQHISDSRQPKQVVHHIKRYHLTCCTMWLHNHNYVAQYMCDHCRERVESADRDRRARARPCACAVLNPLYMSNCWFTCCNGLDTAVARAPGCRATCLLLLPPGHAPGVPNRRRHWCMPSGSPSVPVHPAAAG